MVAGFALAATMAMTACSSSDSDSADTTTTTAAVTTTEEVAATGDLPPVPTAADLNAELARGFDPNVPLDDKVRLVQGAEIDPELINKVAEAARLNNAVVTVDDVTDLGDGTLSANATMTINDQVNPLVFTFIAEDGIWKLSQQDACNIVNLAQIQSPACPAAAPAT